MSTICFSFWISHVPLERFPVFAEMVAGALRPGGKVFFVDGRHEPTSTAADHTLPIRLLMEKQASE